jgi:5-oxoprolinase (ATP-hydrolysing) subunit A
MMRGTLAAIDLNSDLGEGFGVWRLGDDEALLDIVTSANIACGFHAGDPRIMWNLCQLAAARGVAIGAHVAYRDLAGFGRRPMAVEPDELTADIQYQIAALDGFARMAGTRVSYVKPHGALYNTIAADPAQAEVVAEAVRGYGEDLPVVGLAGSPGLARMEARGVSTIPEAFADRGYTPEGRLVPRTEPGAVIHEPDLIAARCTALASTGSVTAIDGSTVRIAARSVCVHGDTPGAVRIARAVRDGLVAAGITLEPFTPFAPPA